MATGNFNRILAAMALLGYLAGTCGLTPSGSSRATSSERYPCEGHACGCRSASACWTECCCLSLNQRLEWARAHGIEPPAALQSSAAANRLVHSCCASAVRESATSNALAAETDSAAHSGHLPAVTPFKCRGIDSSIFSAALPALPVRPPIELPRPQLLERGGFSICLSFISRRLEQPTPPPRRC